MEQKNFRAQTKEKKKNRDGGRRIGKFFSCLPESFLRRRSHASPAPGWGQTSQGCEDHEVPSSSCCSLLLVCIWIDRYRVKFDDPLYRVFAWVLSSSPHFPRVTLPSFSLAPTSSQGLARSFLAFGKAIGDYSSDYSSDYFQKSADNNERKLESKPSGAGGEILNLFISFGVYLSVVLCI